MRKAARVFVIAIVIGVAGIPSAAFAQTADGEPTPAAAVTDTADGEPTRPVSKLDRLWMSDRLHRGLQTSFVTLQVLDVVSTLTALRRPGTRELNPLMAPIVHRPLAVVLIKGAATSTAIHLTRRLVRNGSKKRAAIVMFAIDVAMTAIVANNFTYDPKR